MNVVQKVERLLSDYSRVLADPPNWYEPLHFEVTRRVLPFIDTSDYYEIGYDIADCAHNEAQDFLDSWAGHSSEEFADDVVRMPEDAKAPSDKTLLYFSDLNFTYLIVKDRESSHEGYDVFVLANSGAVYLGGYVMKPYGSDEKGKIMAPLYFSKHVSKEMRQTDCTNIILLSAFVCDIINQPRFVIRSPAATRQQRKFMMRARKISTDAWHKIEWNIAEPVYAPNEPKDVGWNMPLHYKRGHWRKAEAHWDDVVIRKDGKPYKWIEGYWAGHPAYGIKKSYHAPKLGGKHETVYT